MKPRILYVGDSIARLNSIKGLLENQGYDVWTARETGDALRMMRGLDFEVLMMEQALIDADRDQLIRFKRINPDLHVLSVSDGQGEPQQSQLQKALRELERITMAHS